MNKIALIGAGLVGMSFVYSWINQGNTSKITIIDLNKEMVHGHILDLEDSKLWTLRNNYILKAGEYKDLDDVEVLVICAGLPQKPNETRLDLVKKNGAIMKNIAENVKKSKFKGITIVASNPCDVLATIYWKTTKFSKDKIISSGTALDSKRFKFELEKLINISSKSFMNTFLIGEHGDSSVPVVLDPYLLKKLSEKQIIDAYENAKNKAYKIINTKHSSYYGIGITLSNLVSMIINDKKDICAFGQYLNNAYGLNYDIIISLPGTLFHKGVDKQLLYDLTPNQLQKFKKSCEIVNEHVKEVLK